jgi:hypothetical protein
LRKGGQKISPKTINGVLFDYVINGYFSADNLDNTGTIGYRRSIYYNIQEGFNYIYEDINGNKEIIKKLTKEQIETLDEISKNKWYRCTSNGYENCDINGSIQTQLIEQLGIKVYFDDNNKPYVYSHELADNLKIENKHIREKIKKIHKDLTGRKFDWLTETSNFNVSEDFYKDAKGEMRETYKMYKDYLILY